MFTLVNISQCFVFKEYFKTPLNLGWGVAILDLSSLFASRMFWWQGELHTGSKELLVAASAL